uniref:CSON003188 protein n=1 Tax=Culicoides sonorensis TaxID=179676 RepID=A0A336MQG3_CULSO
MSGRIMTKSGNRRINEVRVPQKSLKFLKDIAHTLIELAWWKTVLIFISCYFLSWTFFAMLWYLIAWAHNDLEFDELSGERLNDGKAPCLTGGDTIHGVFMLSMESQVSTGYGEHYPNEECHEASKKFVL